jgi:hypothetical protein
MPIEQDEFTTLFMYVLRLGPRLEGAAASGSGTDIRLHFLNSLTPIYRGEHNSSAECTSQNWYIWR